MSRKSLRKSITGIFKGPEDTHTWGPLLITIGPNCCGKSTFIKSLEEDVTEITTESTPELHVLVPVEIAAKVWQDKISGDVVQALRGQTVYNVPMLDRLKRMRGLEYAYVALLFAKLMSLKEFEAKMEPLLADADYGDIFLGCCRELYQSKGNVLKTTTFDIFIGEAVDFATTQTAAALKAAIKTNEGVICWGNTNLNPDFYKDALKIADKYQRVVRFVRWGKEIPIVPLRELFKRNILRFLETGKYVSSSKLDKFRKHADFFVSKATTNTHIEYASLAEYDMDDIGCVSHKVHPITKKPPRTPSGKFAVWTNVGKVFNLANGPSSPSPLNGGGVAGGATISRNMSRSTSGAGGGGSSNNSVTEEAPAAGRSNGKKSPSVTGSNTSNTGISFSTAANKHMQKVPSDPNLLPLSESNLQANAAAIARSESRDVEPRRSGTNSLAGEDLDTPTSAELYLQTSSGAAKHQPPVRVVEPTEPSAPPAATENTPAAASTPSVAAKLPVNEAQKAPSAPPTPSRVLTKQASGTPSASPAAPQAAHSGFSLFGLLGIKEKETSQRDSPAVSDSGAAKFIIDEGPPTSEHHVHTADHKVLLQDSLKLTHIHQREASLHLTKEKSVGHATDFKKSNSQTTGIAVDQEDLGTPVETALSPAVFVVDKDSPHPGAITHQPSVNHEVHLQDSVKLAHIHEEEKHLHPHPDEGPIGHPKDHQRHPIIIPPPKHQGSENTTDDEEIGFSSTKSATFVLDDHSPRLTHVKSEDGAVLLQDSVKLTHIHQREASVHLTKEKSVGFETGLSPAVFVLDKDSPHHGAITHQPSVNHEVHLQDSVKLAHIHEEEKHLHPHPDEGPIGHPKDHQRHPIIIPPPKHQGSENTTDDEEIGFSSTKSATFVLDDHSPRLTHVKSEDGAVLLQDSVKLTHIHKTAVHDKPLFNPVIVRNDSFDLTEQQKSAEKKIHRTRSSSPPTRKLSFRASLVEEIPTDSEVNTPTTTNETSGTKVTPRSAAASLFANVDSSSSVSAPAKFILDDKPPALHHQPSLNHEVHLQDSVKLTHLHEKAHQQQQSEPHHAPIHVVKIELTPEQNALQSDKHITFDNHSPAIVPRSAETSGAPSAASSPNPNAAGSSSRGSSIAPSSGKVAPGLSLEHGEEDKEEDDDSIVATLSTPKKDKDPNAFACVFPNLFCM